MDKMGQDGLSNEFPFIKQQKYNDCGLACVKMICSYYAVPFEENLILEQVNFTSKGICIKDIRSALDILGFQTKAICMPEKKLFAQVTLPAIACVELGYGDLYHYLVICKIQEGYVSYANPSNGLQIEPVDEFNKIFTGELILILK